MSTRLSNRRFLILVIPFVSMILMILGIVVTVGMEDFGKMLIDKNPWAIATVVSAMGTVLFLFHKLEILN